MHGYRNVHSRVCGPLYLKRQTRAFFFSQFHQHFPIRQTFPRREEWLTWWPPRLRSLWTSPWRVRSSPWCPGRHPSGSHRPIIIQPHSFNLVHNEMNECANCVNKHVVNCVSNPIAVLLVLFTVYFKNFSGSLECCVPLVPIYKNKPLFKFFKLIKKIFLDKKNTKGNPAIFQSASMPPYDIFKMKK